MASPTTTTAWQALEQHSAQFKADGFRLRDLFRSDPTRFDGFSIEHEALLLDFSKNYLTKDSKKLLLELAEQQNLPAAIAAMFNGDKINPTEDRAALHVALREPAARNRHDEVAATLDKMTSFVERVHSGAWTGFSGKTITDVVNLGIGGSDLGPAMVTDALADFSTGHLTLHFVSNVDPSHINNTLKRLNPETTLFIVASKSFTTLETHLNAAAARAWLLDHATDTSAISKHFVAISTNLDAAAKFGIAADNLFPLWDWVGGRYSLWSAIGLPIALAIGMPGFRQLLNGAHAMDLHFKQAELGKNIPVMMALLTVWYTSFFDSHSTAVIPYSQRLNLLPSYLQQLYMESLGKSVDLAGESVACNTGEVLWGTAGTNGQHSYFQLLHQGTGFIPVDFIACARSAAEGSEEQHQHLLANCFSQSLALMEGQQTADTPHKKVAGNKPSNTLLLQELNPYNLGSLIALFEHKVYVQSVLWDINAFDQWGVELGKKLSAQVFDAFTEGGESALESKLDESSQNLIKKTKEWNS